jgi:nicotinamide-nucleotide amidase
MEVAMLDERLLGPARDVLRIYRDMGWRLATAESCTGGLIAAALTAVPGSSDVVERGLVTYTNAAKTECLGVDNGLFASVGAVSQDVAAAMAEGAVARAPVDAAVAVTGVAGPGGGTEAKPVGLVYIAVATRNGSARVEQHLFDGDRDMVRTESVRAALAMLRDAASTGDG